MLYVINVTKWLHKGLQLSISLSIVSFAFLFLSLPAAQAADPGLYVVTVVNNQSSAWKPSDFAYSVKSGARELPGSPTSGTASPGKLFSVGAGQYTVVASLNERFSTSYSGDCSATGIVSLAQGESKTCNIIFSSMLPKLHIITTVVNDNGGTASVSNFKIHVKNGNLDVINSPSAGTDIPGTTYDLAAGTYVVSVETNNSYATTFSGDCDANGNVTLSAIGENKVCNITNNDNQNTAGRTVPGFPNTGNVTPAPVCISVGNLYLIVGGLIIVLGTSFFLIYRSQIRSYWTKK